MTYYQKEVERIKDKCFANEGQLQVVRRARMYIQNHFDKSVNLQTLSKIGFISKFHLLRLFKRYYGQTPHQFCTDIRIQNAKILLKNGTSVSETCYIIGFECPSSFSTLFKNRFGTTPSEFQKRAILTKSNIG